MPRLRSRFVLTAAIERNEWSLQIRGESAVSTIADQTGRQRVEVTIDGVEELATFHDEGEGPATLRFAEMAGHFEPRLR